MLLERFRKVDPELRSVLAGCVVSALLFPGAALADLDKEAVKEKEDKESRPVLDGEEHEREHQRLLKVGEENLKEIKRLLDEIQKQMAQKNTGDTVQAPQRKAVERIEELIKELNKG